MLETPEKRRNAPGIFSLMICLCDDAKPIGLEDNRSKYARALDMMAGSLRICGDQRMSEVIAHLIATPPRRPSLRFYRRSALNPAETNGSSAPRPTLLANRRPVHRNPTHTEPAGRSPSDSGSWPVPLAFSLGCDRRGASSRAAVKGRCSDWVGRLRGLARFT
jgi:hypothetical protein